MQNMFAIKRVLARIFFVASVLGLTSASIGCAGAEMQADEEVAPSPEDKLYDYRTVLRQLRDTPFADEAGRQLDLAEVWIERAERMAAQEDADEEMLDLQLRAIEGQLVRVRTFYARREAEEALETRRQNYAQRMETIESMRQKNKSDLSPLDAQGGNQ